MIKNLFKKLGIIIAFLILNINQSFSMKIIPRDSWNEYKFFGPVAEFENRKKIYCDIKDDYTVTCYAENPSRCVSFNLKGIIGLETNDNFDFLKAYNEALEICNSENTFNISNEFQEFINSNPNYCLSIKNADNNLLKNTFIEYYDITYKVPTLYNMIKNTIEASYNLIYFKKIIGLEIFAYNFEPTDKMDYSYEVHKLEFKNKTFKFNALCLRDRFLLNTSDFQIKNIIGHEIMHFKQQQFNKEFDELEADLGSLLANNNPGIAIWIGRNIYIDPKEEYLFISIDKLYKDLEEKNEYGYPKAEIRILFNLVMYSHFKKAQDILFSVSYEPDSNSESYASSSESENLSYYSSDEN